MSDTYEQQYNPISNVETEDGNPLTVRYFRDLADGVNNFKQAFPIKLVSHIDGYVAGTYTPIIHNELTLNTYVVVPFGKFYVPSGYNKFLIQVGHRKISGASEVHWYFYFMDGLYRTGTASLSGLSNFQYAVSDVIVSEDEEYIITETTISTSIRDANNCIWIMLVADPQNDSTLAGIQTLDITCLVE